MMESIIWRREERRSDREREVFATHSTIRRTILFSIGNPYRNNDSGSLLTREPLPLAISLADAIVVVDDHCMVTWGDDNDDDWASVGATTTSSGAGAIHSPIESAIPMTALEREDDGDGDSEELLLLLLS